MLGQEVQNLHLIPSPPPPPPPQTADHNHHHQVHMHQLLLFSAQLISRSDFSAAHRLISFLSSNSSPYGDSSDRIIHYFTKALSLRLGYLSQPNIINMTTFRCNNNESYSYKYDEIIIQSSYLSLNQITPFLRFCHLTANQAILEAIGKSNHHAHNIHILDFDIMHGLQWPPLMQAIVDRYGHPPTLRVTATGTNLETLRRTGDRLSNFAHSLGLSFRFHPLLIPENDNFEGLIYHLSAIILLPNEFLAVNCALYLHRFLQNRKNLCFLLKKIKTLNPKVVTIAEKEANHNHPLFLSRFNEALKYYTSVFDSLEATLPPNNRERIVVEEVWFGREIADVVSAEGEKRKERHERFRSWEVMMRNAGFGNIAVSSFAVSQAKLLLRLHYPSQGYNLEVFDESLILGWGNQPLFTVSSWR